LLILAWREKKGRTERKKKKEREVGEKVRKKERKREREREEVKFSEQIFNRKYFSSNFYFFSSNFLIFLLFFFCFYKSHVTDSFFFLFVLATVYAGLLFLLSVYFTLTVDL
jgi:hypothetical protein